MQLQEALWPRFFFLLGLAQPVHLSPMLVRTACFFALMSLAHAATEPKMSSTAETEIRQLLKKTPLIDGHNDLPWQYRKRSNDFSSINLRADTRALKMVTDIPRLREGGMGGQFWSVYIPTETNGAAAIKAVLAYYNLVDPRLVGIEFELPPVAPSGLPSEFTI